MSYDVLDGFRRRLVALRDSARNDRRSDEPKSAPSDRTAAVLADGGDRSEADDDAHLRELPDGAGCAEIWEHLSERQVDDGGPEESQADDRRTREGPPRECQADD